MINLKNKFISKYIIFIILLIYLIFYYFIRAMNDPLKLYIIKDFGINEGDFGLFTSLFSLGYGLSQALSAIIIVRYKAKAISLYIFFSGLIMLCLCYINNFKYLIILRFILGMLCSGSMIGFIFFLTNIFNESYGVLISIVKFITIICSGYFSLYLNTLAYLNYNNIFQFTGIFLLILSIFFFIFVSFNNIFSQDKIENENNNYIVIFTNKSFLLMIIISILSATQYYGLIDGYLKPLPNISSYITNKNITSILISMTAPLLLFTGIFTKYFSCKNIIIILGFIQFICTISIFFTQNCFFTILGIACGYNIHLIIQTRASQIFQKKAALYISILNMLTMIIGASMSEYLSSQVIKYYFNNSNSTLSTLMLIKFYGGLGFLSFLLSFKLL
jgi:MFS family permease